MATKAYKIRKSPGPLWEGAVVDGSTGWPAKCGPLGKKPVGLLAAALTEHVVHAREDVFDVREARDLPVPQRLVVFVPALVGAEHLAYADGCDEPAQNVLIGRVQADGAVPVPTRALRACDVALSLEESTCPCEFRVHGRSLRDSYTSRTESEA